MQKLCTLLRKYLTDNIQNLTKMSTNYTLHITHLPGGRLPLLFARPAVTFPAKERHRPSTSTKLYCLVTEAHRCERLAQRYYATLFRWENWVLNPRPIDRKSNTLQLCRWAQVCYSSSNNASRSSFRPIFLMAKIYG